MVFNRKRKIRRIRKIGKDISIASINGIMNPTQLWLDGGIRSQGYGRVDYCFHCTIPKDFVRGWEAGKGRRVESVTDKVECIYSYYFDALEEE